jgi:hypothetical protein
MKFDINSFLDDARKEFIAEAGTGKDHLDLKKVDISESDIRKPKVGIDDLAGIAYILGFRKINRFLSILNRLNK